MAGQLSNKEFKQIIEISGGGTYPEQYKGILNTGEHFYVRYRWGCGSIIINNEYVADINAVNDPYRGYFKEKELKTLFAKANIELNENLI